MLYIAALLVCAPHDRHKSSLSHIGRQVVMTTTLDFRGTYPLWYSDDDDDDDDKRQMPINGYQRLSLLRVKALVFCTWY